MAIGGETLPLPPVSIHLSPQYDSNLTVAFINARDKLKLLMWDKRLKPHKFHWPRHLPVAVVTLTGEQLNWLLDGYDR